MRSAGGVATSKIQSVTGGGQHAVIVGGGEVVGAGWFSMWASMQSERSDSIIRFGRKVVPRGPREWFGRLALGGQWQYPFVPQHPTIRALGFNAVGAAHSAILPSACQRELWGVVATSNSATVRDVRSAELASQFGLELPVVPDSAAALFETRRFADYRSLTPAGGSVQSSGVVVQMSRAWANGCTKETIDALSRIGTEADGLTLLAVGMAGAHSDQVGLGAIASQLKCPTTLLVPQTIDEIVETIARSSLIIASSLHVNITAMAAGIKQVPLGGVKKLAAYMETWGFEYERPVAGWGIVESAGVATDQESVSARVSRAQKLAALAKEATDLVVRSTFDDCATWNSN